MILKAAKMLVNVVPLTHLSQKGTWFESWLTSLLPNYWTLLFYRISKKKLYSVQIWLKVGPNCPFSSRDILWENWLSLFCAYCVPSYYNISKKSQRANHQTRFHNFGPNWAWVAPSTKRKFIGNIGHHCINLLYPIMLHNFKKILREQILRLHNFCPNCSSWKID